MKYFFFSLISFYFVSVSFAQMPTNGLVSYYLFNGNANDQNGGKNNGTVQGATLTADRFGNANAAYSFNGKDNLIDLGASSSIRQKKMTFSLWVKLNSYNTSVQSYVNQPFVTTRSSTSGAAYEAIFIGMHIPTSTFATATSSASGNQSVIISQEKATIGEWFHLVYTFDDNETKLYINCKLVGTSNKSYSSQYLLNDPVLLGYVGSKSGGNFCWLNGCLDDVYIYDRILEPSEFQNVCCAKNANPLLITSKDVSSCQSTNTITADAKGGTLPLSYEWNNGEKTASIAVSNTIPSNNKYIVTVTDACGQRKSDTVNVKLYLPATATISVTNPEFCAGSQTPIIVSFTGVAPWDYTYSIDGIIQKSKTSSQNPDTIFASKSGNYKLIELNKNLCAIVNGDVKANQLPKIPEAIAGLDKSINCKTDTVSIGTITNPLYAYSWSNGSTNAMQKVTLVGNYYLTVVDSKYKCSTVDSVKVFVDKKPPLIKFNDKKSVNCASNKIQIDASASAQGKQFTYFWEGGQIENGQNTLTPTVSKEGLYVLKISDTESGCVSKDSINIVFCIPRIFTPNTFSPNDDGVNDNFTLFADEATVLKIKDLQVYDRWGNLVFSNKDFNPNEPDKGWDGTFRGQLVPKGVYTWMAEVLLIDNSIKKLSGEVLVNAKN